MMQNICRDVDSQLTVLLMVSLDKSFSKRRATVFVQMPALRIPLAVSSFTVRQTSREMIADCIQRDQHVKVLLVENKKTLFTKPSMTQKKLSDLLKLKSMSCSQSMSTPEKVKEEQTEQQQTWSINSSTSSNGMISRHQTQCQIRFLGVH